MGQKVPRLTLQGKGGQPGQDFRLGRTGGSFPAKGGREEKSSTKSLEHSVHLKFPCFVFCQQKNNVYTQSKFSRVK